MRRYAYLLLLTTVLANCGGSETLPKFPSETNNDNLVKTSFSKLPNWPEANLSPGLFAFQKACKRFSLKKASSKVSKAWKELGTNGEWASICKQAQSVDASNAKEFIEKHFRVFEVKNPANEGLFTGYFEPEFEGSRRQSQRYQHPLYKLPGDVIMANLGDFEKALGDKLIYGQLKGKTFKPYYSRAEIADGALQGKGLELVWLADPVDGFFIEIQGSGRIKLAEGGWMRIGYAGKNGRPYRAIGRDLIEMGEIPAEKMSMSAIRNWLSANSSRSQSVMNKNPSYIFFKERHGDGPIGAAGTALTPGYSLAVDPSFIPLGGLVYLDAEHPDESQPRIQRLVAAEDTGSAIKGAQRGDLFWGTGSAAGKNAGHMASKGRYYLLSPK